MDFRSVHSRNEHDAYLDWFKKQSEPRQCKIRAEMKEYLEQFTSDAVPPIYAGQVLPGKVAAPRRERRSRRTRR